MLTVKVGEARKLWAVYSHSINGAVQFIGISKLKDVFTLTDARANLTWLEMFGDPQQEITITINMVSMVRREVAAERARLVKLLRPSCNLAGSYVPRTAYVIVCNETGETFDNAKQAAEAHGITTSALSNHLNRKPTFRTVGGRTYERVRE